MADWKRSSDSSITTYVSYWWTIAGDLTDLGSGMKGPQAVSSYRIERMSSQASSIIIVYNLFLKIRGTTVVSPSPTYCTAG